jgi:hypothetical protein
MKAQRKALVEELLQTLAPHLTGLLKEDQLPGKALTKTIHQLAEQLLRARTKQQERANKPQVISPKATQQRLTDTLTAALDTELADSGFAGKKAKQAIAETAEHLATTLTKLRRKRKKSRNLKFRRLIFRKLRSYPLLRISLPPPLPSDPRLAAGSRASRNRKHLLLLSSRCCSVSYSTSS